MLTAPQNLKTNPRKTKGIYRGCAFDTLGQLESPEDVATTAINLYLGECDIINDAINTRNPLSTPATYSARRVKVDGNGEIHYEVLRHDKGIHPLYAGSVRLRPTGKTEVVAYADVYLDLS